MPAIRGSESKKKTRRRRRDLDQIHRDIYVAGHLAQYKQEKSEEDLPGLGNWYCTECAKWFDQEDNLRKHLKSKVHKKRYVFYMFENVRMGSLTKLDLLGLEPYKSSHTRRRRQKQLSGWEQITDMGSRG